MRAPSSRYEQVGGLSHQQRVEVVRWRLRQPPAGGRVVRRARRIVWSLVALAGLAAAGSVAIALTVPRHSDRYTPLLGAAVALSLAALGSSLIAWTKLLLPPELAVEQPVDGDNGRPGGGGNGRPGGGGNGRPGGGGNGRPGGGGNGRPGGGGNGRPGAGLPEPSRPPGWRRLTRRPLLTGALALGVAAAGTPLAVRLLRNEQPGSSAMEHTGWDPAGNGERPVRLVREDGSPVRPDEVSVGGMVTVFPGIPGGASNRHAGSPAMLIRLRAADAARLRENLYELNRGSPAGDFVAYSKICTHVGCPASLYEQQTNRLLCPCHQSQFLVTDNARPVFGPATRSLAMLPIALDEEGYFVATSDFKVPVGPSYWER